MMNTKTTTPKADATAEDRGVSAQRGALGRSLAATAEARDEGIGRYELIRQRNKAEAQRDELLAAAKAAKSMIEQFDIAFEDETDDPLPIINTLRAAIANAERGQK